MTETTDQFSIHPGVPPRTAPRRLKRLWMPVLTLLLGIGGMTALVKADALEPMTQFYIMSGIILGVPALLVLWLMFFSGLHWLQRFVYLIVGSVATAGILFGLWHVLRMDGSIGGSGWPRLKWIWTRSTEASLDELKTEPGEAVDLTVKNDTDYPQFLGRDHDGVAHGVRLARDWKASPPKELWRRSIGLGWSAFAVVGDYAVTQEQREDKELVVCYELKTGKARWKHEHNVRFHDPQGGDGPRATPTIVEGRVYTLGGTGILDCIDGASGKNIWSCDTLKENKLKNIKWGKSCSPLVFDDKVIVTGGQEKKDSLLAYHKDTGDPLWRVGKDDASYSSPALATLADEKQILSVNAHSVTGHDPKDGKVLWNFPWPGGVARASQPVLLPGDRIFLSAGYNVGCVLLHITRGSDDLQVLAAQTVTSPTTPSLASATTQLLAVKRFQDLFALWSAEPMWTGRNKMCTQFSNVVIAQNCAFGLDCRELACIDLESGERKWKGKTYQFGQVMLVGDLIVVQAEDGYVALVEANPNEFKELARLPGLKDKTWNNPVLSGPYLLIRNDREAVCYQLPVLESDK